MQNFRLSAGVKRANRVACDSINRDVVTCGDIYAKSWVNLRIIFCGGSYTIFIKVYIDYCCKLFEFMYNCYFSITIHWPYTNSLRYPPCWNCDNSGQSPSASNLIKKSERYTPELGLIQFNIISRFRHAKVAERKVLIYVINNIKLHFKIVFLITRILF
jgi:hypothetical protein